MNVQESIKLLIQVALLAQSKGILSLEEAVLVLDAIKVSSAQENSPAQDEKMPFNVVTQ
jgi:hypothetical protein